MMLQKSKFRKKKGVTEFQIVTGETAKILLAGGKIVRGKAVMPTNTATAKPHSSAGGGDKKSKSQKSGNDTKRQQQQQQPPNTHGSGQPVSLSGRVSRSGGRTQVLKAVDEVLEEVLSALEPKLNDEAVSTQVPVWCAGICFFCLLFG